jgi:hypothetical protein
MPIFVVRNSSDIIPVGTACVLVENRKIKELPPLPESLTELSCYNCTSLRKLPPLPVGLTELDCFRCTSLCELPPLPESLEFLGCSGCTSLRELPPLPKSLKWLSCSDCTSLLYLPIIPRACACDYCGPSLPTEEEYFEEINMGKNQEFVASRGDALLYRIIEKDITDIVKGYLS